MRGPKLRAFKRGCPDRLAGVLLDTAWRGLLPTLTLRSSHPVREGIRLNAWRGLNRCNKEYRIPRNRVCPVCDAVKPAREQWIVRFGYIPVCKVCARAGYLPSTQKQLRRCRKKLATSKQQHKPTTIAERNYKRLIRICGEPPVCWHCKQHVPTGTSKYGLPIPGQLWVLKKWYKPTCRACWNAGARKKA